MSDNASDDMLKRLREERDAKKRAEADQERSEALEASTKAALDMLKAGLQDVETHGAAGVAIVIVLPDGAIVDIKPTACPEMMLLISGLELLKHKLVERVMCGLA